VSKALKGEQLCGPQHEGQTCSVVRGPAREGGSRGSRAAVSTAKAMDAVKNLNSQPPRTLRRMGCGTFRIVTAGTGEALPGPVTCDVVAGETCPITGLRREVGVGWASARRP